LLYVTFLSLFSSLCHAHATQRCFDQGNERPTGALPEHKGGRVMSKTVNGRRRR
jgi:hypothetical protein